VPQILARPRSETLGTPDPRSAAQFGQDRITAGPSGMTSGAGITCMRRGSAARLWSLQRLRSAKRRPWTFQKIDRCAAANQQRPAAAQQRMRAGLDGLFDGCCTWLRHAQHVEVIVEPRSADNTHCELSSQVISMVRVRCPWPIPRAGEGGPACCHRYRCPLATHKLHSYLTPAGVAADELRFYQSTKGYLLNCRSKQPVHVDTDTQREIVCILDVRESAAMHI
jgi:hypothetical protein